MADETLTQTLTSGNITIVEFGPKCELIEDSVLEALGEELLESVRGADPPQVILDLSRTRFFGSGFIEVLLRVWKELQQSAHPRMVLCGVQTYCREVLEITHLDQLWPIHETRDAAMAQLSSLPEAQK